MATTHSSTRSGARAGKAAHDGGDPGGDGDGHREDVVDQQGRPGHQPGQDAQVVLGDDVAPAPVGVGLDRLLVGGGHHRQEGHDAQAEGHGQGQGAGPGQDQDAHDLLGGVGRRGDVVRGEDGQPLDLGQALVHLLGAADRRPHQEALEAPPGAGRARPGLRLLLHQDVAGGGGAQAGEAGADDAHRPVAGVPPAPDGALPLRPHQDAPRRAAGRPVAPGAPGGPRGPVPAVGGAARRGRRSRRPGAAARRGRRPPAGARCGRPHGRPGGPARGAPRPPVPGAIPLSRRSPLPPRRRSGASPRGRPRAPRPRPRWPPAGAGPRPPR